MAVVASRFDPAREFSRSEAELQDHVLDIYGTKEHEVDLFRPNIADQHKVGFFTLDRCSQTEVSEVVDLKEMTEVLQILLQDVTNLRRDINLTKHVMQADYESKLQEKSLELYVRINEKVKELERIHEDRVSTVRRAFRQQLSDAIARVAVLYNKNLESKIKKEKRKQEEGQDKHDEKYKEMQATIQRNETVIQMLKMQLAQFQQRRNSEVESPEISSDRPSNTTAASPVPSLDPQKKSKKEPSPTKERAPPPQKAKSPPPSPSPKPPPKQVAKKMPPVIEELSVKSKSPSVNEEFEALKEECDGLHRRVDRLEEALDIKDNENVNLMEQVNQLNSNLEKEKIMVDQLKYEAEETKKLAEKEKESSKSQLAKQKQEMQRMMDEQIRRAKEEAENARLEEARSLKEAEGGKIKLLMDQKKQLEQELMQERKKNSTKSQEVVDEEKYKKVEQKLRDEILRLKKEIERIHRTWEKKFAILQQSLHALKDESYIRQTLQRQAAALHHAAVSYAADTPAGIVPQKPQSYPRKPVIPDIPKKPQPSNTPAINVNASAGGMGMPDKDYISYTVSAPSGRGTAMLSVDENQVMSDGEQMPEDVDHIPPPPIRRQESPDNAFTKTEDGLYSSQSQPMATPTISGQ
ncbi:uncharacterized protein C10orf67, mitochondrial-like isoform X2 [Ostrea edulis]|uniref:uncharacterized protein C10orf67, mitochondrial-like isoform X2 n=1 Tax=Ostrea edulis TaxID=37623 RepID=UPI0024AEB43F|nr:uncharacterized protein C10orf67, mitochondrial-like isoform X2 [Ostrea edulis]